MEEITYYLYGYDKDADVYEKICDSQCAEFISYIAKSVTHYHYNVRPLCSIGNNEPFDRFVIQNEEGNTLRIFTSEYPDGIRPVE